MRVLLLENEGGASLRALLTYQIVDCADALGFGL